MHDPTDPAAPDETSPRGGLWRDVARVTFHHHLRGPWAVALGLVGVLPVLSVFILGEIYFGARSGGLARDAVPFLAEIPRRTIPLLLLLLVVPAYRGAWLRDPRAARERVLGFFAGTWAATLAALLPWLGVTLLLTAWKTTFVAATLASLLHFAALGLLAAVWIALGVLLAVLFRREETRWLGVALTYLGLTYLLSYAETLALSLWRSANGAGFGEASPAWLALFRVLDPGALSYLFAASLAPRSYEPFAEDLAGNLLLGTAYGTLALLALWIALPLVLAMRVQARSEAPLAPLEHPL